MSANSVVDLGNTVQVTPTVINGSGNLFPCSGAVIGASVNLINADSMCQVQITGCPTYGSGQIRVQVQCSDSDVSGTFTDPTSGLAQMPSVFTSGGIVTINSGGLNNGIYGPGVSGQFMLSGFSAFAAFQRPGQFARANLLSGDFFAGNVSVNLLSQLKVTGSGGGYTLSPSSGGINV